MKKFLSAALLIGMLACNSQSGNSIESVKDSNQTAIKHSEERASGSIADNCGNNLAFRKGAVIQASSYDGEGKETSKQTSTVTKVYTEKGMTVSELTMKSTDADGANDKTVNAIYKCDGKKFYVDIAGIVPGNEQGGEQGSDIKTSGLDFPFNVSVGESLPDYDYTINMGSAGKSRTITSHVKERKVEAKEAVATAAGSFECYKISSVIESDVNMPEMDEQSKKIMEEVKKKMGKNKMTFWYAPDVGIIKMEFHMGDKLITRSEVTSIKK